VNDLDQNLNQSFSKTAFIIEIDDAKEIDILKSILDPFLPQNVVLLNTEFDLNNYKDQKIDPANVILVNKATRFLF